MFAQVARSGAVVGSDEQRLLAAAEGVLLALRRYTPQAAADELRTAARRHGVPLSTIALALVDLASCRPVEGTPGPAHVAAQKEWGSLLGSSDAVAA
jgi:hypothetical protein